MIKMPKTRVTPKVCARYRATPTSAESSSKRCSRWKANEQQDASEGGAVAVESGVGGGAPSDIPYEYRVSVDASGVDVDVSRIAWPTVVDTPAQSTARAGLVPPVAVALPPASVGDSPPELAFGSDSADASATQPPMLACVCDDLGSDVPILVKEKVWRGEFIELGTFLKRGLSALSEETSFSLVQAGASLQVRQASRAPRIANIEQWTTAFLAYASIFVEKHFGRARELFKYTDTVRSIVRFGGYNWRAYDVQFRLRQARQPHRSWAVIDTELWLTVATA